MKLIIGLVAAAGLLAKAPGTAAVPNRAPLRPNVFYALPLGTVKPAGWLRQQLRIQADGLSGHLDEIWPDVGTNSAWLGGTGEGWERGPYYLDGLLPLAYLLDDPLLIAKARKWVDYTLDHQRADGLLGPEASNGKPTSDWWPNMVMLKVLTQYQEVTGDERVIPAMEKYFAYQASQLEANPLHEWAQYRWGDELLSIIWLYNRNGDAGLLDLARKVAAQGFDWKALFADYPFKDKVEKKDSSLQTHGVNNAMAMKTGALWSQITGDAADRDSSGSIIDTLDRYHGLPGGTFAADEHMAGHDPSQGTELCAIVEQMFSLEQLMQITGNPHLANRLERIAFNALPGAFSKDMWAHQYDQQLNQVLVSDAKRNWTTNGSKSNVFGLEPNFGCCTANMHQGWPKFAASLWMASADSGIAAVNYSPSEVRTTVNGTPVHIVETTSYPFAEEISITIDPDQPASFPLRLRIPGWTAGAVVRVNGAAQRDVKPGTFLTITREWKSGDTILMRMPMPVLISRTYRDAVFISRGPLLYSLAIGTRWKKIADHGAAADWEVNPTSPWNYALVVNTPDPQSSFSVQVKPMSKQPFSPEGTPVEIHAKGVLLRDWKLLEGSAGPVPQAMPKHAGLPDNIVLIPYGAAKLRITEFPQVLKDK